MEQLAPDKLQILSEYSGLPHHELSQQDPLRNRLLLAYYFLNSKNPDVDLAMNPQTIDKLFPLKHK